MWPEGNKACAFSDILVNPQFPSIRGIIWKCSTFDAIKFPPPPPRFFPSSVTNSRHVEMRWDRSVISVKYKKFREKFYEPFGSRIYEQINSDMRRSRRWINICPCGESFQLFRLSSASHTQDGSPHVENFGTTLIDSFKIILAWNQWRESIKSTSSHRWNLIRRGTLWLYRAFFF